MEDNLLQLFRQGNRVFVPCRFTFNSRMLVALALLLSVGGAQFQFSNFEFTH